MNNFIATMAIAFGVIAAPVEAAFSNSGTFSSVVLNLNVGGTLDNNGSLIAKESAKISCDTFTGNGLLQSPIITLKTKVFAFTGTIDCTQSCTIVASMPFDEKMFKKVGKGEFTIVIDENFGKTLSVQDFDQHAMSTEIYQ